MSNERERETETPAEKSLLKRLFFSGGIAEMKQSRQIAYIAVMTAFTVVANMFFEFKLADVQFSLTIVVSALSGILLGGAFGFVASFLGDLVGFLYNSGGYAYYPWIGLSMGLVALLAGVLVGGVRMPVRFGLQIKLAILSVVTFLLCTVAINTTAFWILYTKGVPYHTYLFTRLFVQGQIWNSLFNYGLLFVLVPVLGRVKPLKLNIR
ncbi:MAG: ECF transporter S component [Clostridia bacterium]|nr:ECF transporter S component [Clostridia bacterium]